MNWLHKFLLRWYLVLTKFDDTKVAQKSWEECGEKEDAYKARGCNIYKQDLDRMLDHVAASLEGLQPESKLLDLGCGTGLLLQRLKKYKSFGIDISFSALNQHAAKVNQGKLVCADLLALPFQGNFEAVLFCDVVQLLPPAAAAKIIRSACDYLAPGGKFVLCFPRRTLIKWIKNIFYPQKFYYLYTLNFMKKNIAKGGLEILERKDFTWGAFHNVCLVATKPE